MDMMNMNVVSTNQRLFTLFSNDELLGTLKYNKWFSNEVVITEANGTELYLKKKKVMDSISYLYHENAAIASMQMKWMGIEIGLLHHAVAEKYLLKKDGFMRSNFILTNAEGIPILRIKLRFTWKTLRNTYHIDTLEKFENIHNNHILTLLSINGINYLMRMAAAT